MAPVQHMLIQLSKRADGEVVLRCQRPDGSATWQKQAAAHARFFALHDLTHLAVETLLGFRRGFFGLIAEGWDIADTTGKGSRGPLPAEALLVEQIVGFLDAERAGGRAWTADEFNDHLANAPATRGLAERRVFTKEELDDVRAEARRLWEAWLALPADAQMDLRFPARQHRNG